MFKAAGDCPSLIAESGSMTLFQNIFGTNGAAPPAIIKFAVADGFIRYETFIGEMLQFSNKTLSLFIYTYIYSMEFHYYQSVTSLIFF